MSEPQPSLDDSRSAGIHAPWVPAAAWWIGITATLVGVVDGIVQMLQRRVIGCPDGTFFPNGTTDFRCWSHPHAGTGLAITTTSIGLASVIVLAGVLLARVPPPAPTSETG